MKKIFFAVILGIILLYSFIVRFQYAHTGLPYLYHWDEPFITTSAVNILKTGDHMPKYGALTYGGFLRYTCLAIDWFYYQYLHVTNQVMSTDEIKTSLDGGFRTFSHPGFYFANRIWTSIIALFGIWLVYLITVCITKNRWAGLISAFILSLSNIFIEGSYFTTVDVPMAVLTIASLYFALRFNAAKKIKFLYLSLFFAGLSLSTKLTGISSLLFPTLAILFNYKNLQLNSPKKFFEKVCIWISIPLVTFLFLNPAIYLDTKNFFEWNSFAVKQYREGMGHFSKTPGFEHLGFQLASIKDNIGFITFIFGFIGIILTFFSSTNGEKSIDNKIFKIKQIQNGLFIFLYPLIFILTYTFSYRVAYHRNMMVLYPFFAVGTGILINFLTSKGLNFLNKPEIKVRLFNTLSLIVFLLFVVGSWSKLKYFYETSKDKVTLKDTRTVAIDKLNALTTKEVIGIPTALQFSEFDLKKLKHPYRIFSPTQFEKAFKENSIVLLGNYKSQDGNLNDLDYRSNEFRRNAALIFSLKGDRVYLDSIGPALEVPTQNPQIYFLKGIIYDSAIIIPFPVFTSNSKVDFFFNESKLIGELFLDNNSNYEIIFDATATSCKGVYPHINLYLDGELLRSFYFDPNEPTMRTKISNIKKGKHKLELEFDNDLADDKEDRNISINGFKIIRSR